MRRLTRDSVYTDQNSLEVRVQQLERRIFPRGTFWAAAHRDTNQLIDNNAELIVFNSFITNNADMFQESSGSDGIDVNEVGYFETAGFIQSATGTAISRNTYVQSLPLSSYPTFGTEFGIGTDGYPFDSSLLDDTNLRQNHHAFGSMAGTATDPYKTVLVAVRNAGVNYTVSAAGLVIVFVGEYPT